MKMSRSVFTAFLFVFLSIQTGVYAQQLTFEDVMKFEDIQDPVISTNGNWVAYGVWPDRGDGEVRVRSTENRTMYSIPLGTDPVIAKSERWVGAFLQPPLAEQLKNEKKKPKQGLGILDTGDGEIVRFDSVQSFSFSNDGKWVTFRHYPEKEMEDEKSKNGKLGTNFVLRNLESGEETAIPFVTASAFDSTSTYLAYSVVDTTGTQNGLYVINLGTGSMESEPIDRKQNGYYSNLSWTSHGPQLAFTAAELDDKGKPGEASLFTWHAGNGDLQQLVATGEANEGYVLRSENDLRWTRNGKRLFFGFRWKEFADTGKKTDAEDDTTKTANLYDRDEILKDKELDVWHWDDPRIKPHEKNTWNNRKNHLYRAVYHLDSDRWVQLADREVPEVRFTENPNHALGSSSVPYLKLMTWEGFFDDYYAVDLESGEKKIIAERLRFGAYLSPGGNYAVYYDDRHWYRYDIESDRYLNLTENLEIPFFNEDHDYPYPPGGYGVGGWIEGDDAVLVYDKFDIWQFDLDNGDAQKLTGGRSENRIYRVIDLEPDKRYFSHEEELLLQSYHDKHKNFGFYTANVDQSGATKRLEEEKKFQFVGKAEESDRILYTRESYTEFPNLWISRDHRFGKVKRISALHLDLTKKYDWGTAELVEWNSLDGEPLQGVLIKPGNYEKGKRYPVLIYYYRFFTQRLHDFNEPRTNHRPVFAQYTSDGYAVFLPDIRFDVGTPGFASTKSLVPGVQKLIEMGIADPDGLGLHGHSWSGYQTAFMITQTDIFDAAVAGAPVSNMTSAYSGIRWGSGLARQFQYEETQSRIGGSLWEYPERYIENSPVFYADRITTPLLIQFGDEDGAVPWYQGIELYLAMRRLGKDAVFLQYHGEPHHLQKFSNKLDYAIKMKEYFDYYLKGTPAPEWITDGVPYRGND